MYCLCLDDAHKQTPLPASGVLFVMSLTNRFVGHPTEPLCGARRFVVAEERFALHPVSSGRGISRSGSQQRRIMMAKVLNVVALALALTLGAYGAAFAQGGGGGGAAALGVVRLAAVPAAEVLVSPVAAPRERILLTRADEVLGNRVRSRVHPHLPATAAILSPIRGAEPNEVGASRIDTALGGNWSCVNLGCRQLQGPVSVGGALLF